MGVTESINDILGSFCSGGYGGGTIGQANYNYLQSEYGDVSWLCFGSIYRLGDTVRFRAPVEDSRVFGRFLEDIAGLEDYPIICEDKYQELILRLENEEWDELVREHNLEWEYVHKVRENGDYYFYDSDGMGTLYGLSPQFDVEEFVNKVRTEQQTWMTHYYSQMPHIPDVCGYCKEADLEVA